jgi:hypothetical protein
MLLAVASTAVVSAVLVVFGSHADLPRAESRSASNELPVVPWEGGPAYYAGFEATATAGWTDPAFFPIGVWYESVITQQDVDADKAAGLNTYVELTDNSDLGLVRSNGMAALLSKPLAGHGKETVGWLIDDETDMWAGAGDAEWTGNHPGQGPLCVPEGAGCGYTVLRTLSERLPKDDGRFTYANYGKGVMMWLSDVDAARFVNEFTRVVSTDVYWYTSSGICVDAQNSLSLPTTQCRLAANYGAVIDRQRKLDAVDGHRQPILAFVEVGWPGEDDERAIEPPELAGAVMSSLIHEARGVVYFNHNFGGPCPSQHVLRDACGKLIRPTVTELNRRIRQLAPVLNTQSYQYGFAAGLDTMLKEYQGSYYVFAMVSRGSAVGEHTLTLPPGLSADRVEVLFEDRTLPVDRDGRFSDSFGAEHIYHIYKITSG